LRKTSLSYFHWDKELCGVVSILQTSTHPPHLEVSDSQVGSYPVEYHLKSGYNIGHVSLLHIIYPSCYALSPIDEANGETRFGEGSSREKKSPRWYVMLARVL
jgi:hypothetical protein